MTKEECEIQIKLNGNVCSRCGRKLQALKTVDNSGNPTYWIGCMHGGDLGHFGAGVKPEIYETAKKLVLEDYRRQYNSIDHITNDYEFEYWFQSQVDQWCTIIETVNRFYKSSAKPRHTKEELKNILLKYGV